MPKLLHKEVGSKSIGGVGGRFRSRPLVEEGLRFTMVHTLFLVRPWCTVMGISLFPLQIIAPFIHIQLVRILGHNCRSMVLMQLLMRIQFLF